MSVRNQLKLLVGRPRGPPARARCRRPRDAFRDFLDQSRLVAGLIFILTVAAIVLISSVGVTTINLPVLPEPARDRAGGRRARPFRYLSEEKTRRPGSS